jgi:DNA-binding MarR family transcriptional regulator
MTTDTQLARRAERSTISGDATPDEDRLLPKNIDGLDDIIGLHVGRVYALLTFQLERDLAPLRLTPKEVSCLWLVNANPGIPQAALARFFGIERSSVNVVIKSLIQRELVRAEQNADDRRIFGLFISDAGSELLAQARAIVTEHEQWLCEPLSQTALSDLRQSLETMAGLKR